MGKTTTPFWYDLNQIPYDYSVEVRNRFKGLDLIDRVPDGGSSHRTGDGDQDHPQEKEMQNSKMAVWGGQAWRILSFTLLVCEMSETVQ